MKWIAFTALALAIAGLCVEVTAVAGEIRRQSQMDEARPADAIIVLGAAEYRGKPSPVLEARLNHALFLYLKQMAPRIITTGGAGGDPVFTEGSVGRSYLSNHGVPPEAIIVEREAGSTAQSVAAVAEIMRRMNLRSAIVVSDGYHIFRVKKMLESSGLQVYGSPRPSAPPDRWQYYRQAIGYLLWKIGVAI
ncbi:MAG TPA: YdcF family protein [Bryobacteraceae bacterium]|nr:YdcF family protein [Bryobacteraceae bacterium]